MKRRWKRSRDSEAKAGMRVLGIDCGTERTGYGVIDTDGRAHRMVASGVIRTTPALPFEVRLLEVAAGLRQVIQDYKPRSAAVEDAPGRS